MSQITLYLDDETLARTREAAEAAGVSLSRWVSELLRQRTASQWPASVAALAGSWTDAPAADEIRSPPAEDIPREPF